MSSEFSLIKGHFYSDAILLLWHWTLCAFVNVVICVSLIKHDLTDLNV